jgi:hypothetical protein
MYVISQRLLSQMFATLTALCSVLADVSSTSAAIEYRMVTQHSYECPDVSWRSRANNVTIQLYACHEGPALKWCLSRSWIVSNGNTPAFGVTSMWFCGQ